MPGLVSDVVVCFLAIFSTSTFGNIILKPLADFVHQQHQTKGTTFEKIPCHYVCGVEKMTDNSQEIRPDKIPLRQRQQFLLQLGWEGRAVLSHHNFATR